MSTPWTPLVKVGQPSWPRVTSVSKTWQRFPPLIGLGSVGFGEGGFGEGGFGGPNVNQGAIGRPAWTTYSVD